MTLKTFALGKKTTIHRQNQDNKLRENSSIYQRRRANTTEKGELCKTKEEKTRNQRGKQAKDTDHSVKQNKPALST